MTFNLSWKKDPRIAYPKTWLSFKAKDLDSDNLVEYMIRDLTGDRFEEAFKLMAYEFLKNEPMNGCLGNKYIYINICECEVMFVFKHSLCLNSY